MGVCDNCHAGCCRSFAIPVTGADIIRIEKGTGRDFWDFACRWQDADGAIAQKYAPHFHFDDEPQTPFAICLRQESSTLFPKTTRCRFLMECVPDDEHPLGTARCSIHPFRPASCAAFPTRFDSSGQLAVINPVPERGRPPSQGDVYKLCPRPWEPSDFDQLDAVQQLVVARFEMQIFHQIAAAWNRRPGPWAAFPEFLRMVYARRVIAAESSADHRPQLRVIHPDDDFESLSRAA